MGSEGMYISTKANPVYRHTSAREQEVDDFELGKIPSPQPQESVYETCMRTEPVLLYAIDHCVYLQICRTIICCFLSHHVRYHTAGIELLF